MDEKIVRKECDISVVERDIWIREAREGISRSHSSAGHVDEG